jgi:hypothetical protein
MKNISKIVISLLASVVLTFSANAGELTVTGSAKATYNSVGGTANGANTIGVANELTFGASGELDNGWTWKYAMELDPNGTAAGGEALNDDTQLIITTPYGALGMCASECGLSAAGNFNANAYAWITDTAYAEGKSEPVNISSYQNIQYHTPSGLIPFDTMLKVGYSPNSATVLSSSNGSNVAPSATVSDTRMVRVETGPVEGLDVSASYAIQGRAEGNHRDEQDSESGAVAAKYSAGAFTVGVGKAWTQPRQEDAAGTADQNLTGTVDVDFDENTNVSIAMAVNDNLSISYSNEKSERQYFTSTAVSYDQKTTSAQAAYTMGGMTIGLALTDYDNVAYVQDADVSETLLAVTMAF